MNKKNHSKWIWAICLSIGCATNVQVQAQQMVLELDSCRAMAVRNNKELKIAKGKINAATYERKAAFTNFLPRFNALGTYMRNSREFSLLNSDEKNALTNIGTIIADKIGAVVPGITENNLPALLNQVGGEVADRFRTDTRNVYAGAVTVTQPIYAGGKIIAYNKITQLSEQLAQQGLRNTTQDILLHTDQTYWLVVSLASKKKLAESYLALVNRLNSDVEKMLKEGVATKANLLSVKVKVNEAEMQLTQVEDGLSLSRMALCQICGLDLGTDIVCRDENNDAGATLPSTAVGNDIETAWTNRPEMESLRLATEIYNQKVKVIRADHLPTIGLTGSYLITNPSCFNSFENKFKGMWSVGVAVSMPIFSFGEGTYKVRAAKAEAQNMRYQYDEAKEKIELQVKQCGFKVNEAQKKLSMSIRDCEKAEENLRFANLGFKEGVISISNVLEAQTMWLKSQTAREDAEIEVRLSQVEYQRALGIINQAN